MNVVRDLGRDLAQAAGLLALRHRLRHRETLTVVMFHRVLAPDTPAGRAADPVYTVPAPLFAACLAFFRRHYAVVGLPAVRASLAGGAPLPPRALLITFDDGWQDNLDVALPLLRRAGLPAVVFAAADALGEPSAWWWQEILLRALRTGRAGLDGLWAAAGADDGTVPPATEAPELALLQRYAALDPARRWQLLAPYAAGTEAEGRHMLTPAGLRALAAGLDIGAHGAAHLPLSMMDDAAADLVRARGLLATALGRPGQDGPDTVSFPHGRYNAAVLDAAAAAGFRILFTSDACLNAAPAGRPALLLGRISIEAAAITNASGALAPARLAAWLFHRPVRRLGSP